MKIKTILKEHRFKFGFTLLLIVLEAVLAIFFPLFIGYAIDSALDGSNDGAIGLGLLGLVALLVGVGRRVFDSRFYAKIYQTMGANVISKMGDHLPSKKTARLGMIRELVEFLENSLPELISTVIGLLGVMMALFVLNTKVFMGCLVVTGIIFLIYGLSRQRTLRYNKKTNDELERQVDAIASNNTSELRIHLREVMRWNIKLSDLEAMNFSLSWLAVMAFLIASILIAISDGVLKYGVLFALVMYVFQYIESVINLPFFYQNWLRLKEIVGRLEEK